MWPDLKRIKVNPADIIDKLSKEVQDTCAARSIEGASTAVTLPPDKYRFTLVCGGWQWDTRKAPYPEGPGGEPAYGWRLEAPGRSTVDYRCKEKRGHVQLRVQAR